MKAREVQNVALKRVNTSAKRALNCADHLLGMNATDEDRRNAVLKLQTLPRDSTLVTSARNRCRQTSVVRTLSRAEVRVEPCCP